jgi:hypothetical protein
MPPTWDPEEDKSDLYDRVHQHSSGVISYTLPTPETSVDPNTEVYRRLQELREEAAKNGGSEHAPRR